MTVPKYPLPYDPDDDRLDEDLLGLVADLIEFRTGYPDIDDGPDLERLRRALHGFLYAPDLGDDFDRSQTADADSTPPPVSSRRHPAHLEDARTGEVIEVADGHVVHTCCGKLDDAPHRNFCPKYVPALPEVLDNGCSKHGYRVTAGCSECEARGTHNAGAGIRCSCGDAPDPNCRVHASRFRRPCDDPAPHGEHRWIGGAVLGSTTWTCPGVEDGAR